MTILLLNDRYRVLRTLASGGFGDTFLVEDTYLPSKRKCVLKQLRVIVHNPKMYQLVQERFQREAAVLETLGQANPQIPALYAHFSEAGYLYLVQEWIAGQTLRQKVETSGRFSEQEVLDLLKSLLPVLEQVHAQQIIHRDIKPDNIILRQSDQQPVLIDFGAVKEIAAPIAATQGQAPSIAIGTLGYMPSEQAAGRPVYSSDLYSLGMTAIHLLTACSPQSLPTDPRSGQVIWRDRAEGINPGLALILDKVVSSFPEERYATASEMLRAVQSLQAASLSTVLIPSASTTPVSATPVNVNPVSPTITQKPHPKRIWGMAIAAGVVLLSVVGGVVYTQFSPRRPDSSTPVNPTTANPSTSPGDTSPGDTSPTAPTNRPAQPNNPNRERAEALLKSGNDNTLNGKLDAAIDDYTQVLQLDPKNSAVYALRGAVYEQQNRFEKSIADYNQAIRLDPNFAFAYAGRCMTRQKQKDPEAVVDCTKAVELNPTNPSFYNTRGIVRRGLGAFQKALEDFNKAIELDPAAPIFYYNRGGVYADLDNKNKALRDFATAAQLFKQKGNMSAYQRSIKRIVELGQSGQAGSLDTDQGGT